MRNIEKRCPSSEEPLRSYGRCGEDVAYGAASLQARAPKYPGIDKNMFNRDVRPELSKIRHGRAVPFDRFERVVRDSAPSLFTGGADCASDTYRRCR